MPSRRTARAKKTAKISEKEIEMDVLPGSVIAAPTVENMLNSVLRQNGWIVEHPWGKVLIARNAKSYRTSEPRFSVSSYPLRSTYAYCNWRGSGTWRQLEYKVALSEMPNQHLPLPATAAVLVTVFSVNAA